MPVGAFGGRREIMERIAPLGPVYQAGTLSGNPLAMAAGEATLAGVSAPGFHAQPRREDRAPDGWPERGGARRRRAVHDQSRVRHVRPVLQRAAGALLRGRDGLRRGALQALLPRDARPTASTSRRRRSKPDSSPRRTPPPTSTRRSRRRGERSAACSASMPQPGALPQRAHVLARSAAVADRAAVHELVRRARPCRTAARLRGAAGRSCRRDDCATRPQCCRATSCSCTAPRARSQCSPTGSAIACSPSTADCGSIRTWCACGRSITPGPKSSAGRTSRPSTTPCSGCRSDHALARWMVACCEQPNRFLPFDSLRMRRRKLVRRLLGRGRAASRWGETGPAGLTAAARTPRLRDARAAVLALLSDPLSELAHGLRRHAERALQPRRGQLWIAPVERDGAPAAWLRPQRALPRRLAVRAAVGALRHQ